jgi:hypothetical protein
VRRTILGGEAQCRHRWLIQSSNRIGSVSQHVKPMLDRRQHVQFRASTMAATRMCTLFATNPKLGPVLLFAVAFDSNDTVT